MAIANRIKRLLRADVNAILDVIEEPDAVLKQAIREMQDTLDHEKGLLARYRKQLDALHQNEAFLQEQLTKTQEDLKLCLSQGPDELIRKTIGRKLSCEKHLNTVQRKTFNLERLEEEKSREIEHREDQLKSIIEKAAFYLGSIADDSPFSAADSVLSSSMTGFPMASVHVTDEEIETEWIRIRNQGGES